MKKHFLLLSLVAALAGCASGVKLDEVPVDDRSGAGGASGSSLTGRGLAGMNGVKPGPAGVSAVVYFDYDSYVIKADAQAILEAHARFLRADATRRANLEGHTDERGGREYNLALGQKRAEAVRKALSALSVPEGQMEAVSFGKEKPAAQGADEAAYAQNRRVEITYR